MFWFLNIARGSRPTTVDSFQVHISLTTGVVSIGWNDVTGGTVWLTLTGSSSGTTTYSGGTIVPPTLKGASFSADSTVATVYELTASNVTVTLSSLDTVGTRYEVYDNAGNANPSTTFTPNGGKLITGPGAVGAASINITTQGFWRSVTKMSNGNWLMAGV